MCARLPLFIAERHHSAYFKLAGIALFLLSIILFFPLAAFAQSTSVSIGVGDTSLRVSGYSSPNSFIVILDQGKVIGTTQADATGSYTQVFKAVSPGLHTLSVHGRDQDNYAIEEIQTNVNVTANAETNVTLFLPPSLYVDKPSFFVGDVIKVQGSTYPLASVIVTVDGTTNNTVTASSSGRWSFDFPTVTLSARTYTLSAKASTQNGDQSYSTSNRVITLLRRPAAVPARQATTPIKTPSIPVITKPASNSTFDRGSTITVSGTSDPGSQIEISDTIGNLGSTFSDENGNWSLTLSSLRPMLRMTARACIEELCSLFSDPVYIYQRNNPLPGLLNLTLSQVRYSTKVDRMVTLFLQSEGGRRPYSALISWGDGTKEKVTINQKDVSLSHTYLKSGNYIGIVELRDSDGQDVSASFSVDVHAGQILPNPIVKTITYIVLAATALISIVYIIGHSAVLPFSNR